MVMLKLGRKKILTVALAIVIFMTFLSSTNSFALPDVVTDQPIMYTKSSDDISWIQTRALLDSEDRTHYFVQISYFNYSFVILHVVNDEIERVIESDYYASYTFEARTVGDGIYLFYSLSGQHYGTILRLYEWTEENSEISSIFISQEYHESAYFFVEDDAIHLLYVDENWEANSIIYHRAIYPNGSVINKNYELPFSPYYLRSLAIMNGELFGLLQFSNYGQDHYNMTLTVVGFSTGYQVESYYNSTSITLEMDWFESDLAVGSDNKFHISFVSYGSFYTAEFDINETISESSFTSIALEKYYMSEYHVHSYENATYYVFDEFSDVYYIEDASRYGYDYSVTGKITIITEEENTLSAEEITLERGVVRYSFYSASAYVFENGSYLVSYTSSLSTKQISNFHFLGKFVIAMNLYSDLSIFYPEQPLLFGLKNYSAFAYFWLKYWYALAVPIAVFGLTYAIFHKRINRGIKKLKAFLLRPIIADVSKAKLVFTNIWLFFLNASSLIFVLWRTNKKRLVINLLGFTILATIIIASASLYDSKRNSLVFDYISNYDIYDNGTSSVYFSIPSIGVTIGDLTKNITEMAIEEIVNSIERNTVLFSRIITGYYYSLGSSLSIQVGLDDYIENHAYTESYNPLLKSLLEEGNLPTDSGDILISSYLQDLLDLQLGEIIDLPFSDNNLTIKGIISVPSYSVLISLCKELNLPKDPVNFLTNHNIALNPVDYFFKTYENVTSSSLYILGNIQFSYDFSDISPNEISVLNEELNTLVSRSPYSFSHLPQSIWIINNEFLYAFYGIESTLATAQILVLFILVPIIYLAWFLIFEVNELFGLSFEQEIRILRSKGLSTGNISFIYLSMKTIEAILSALIGFLITLALLPPLIRVDKFLEFKQTPAKISFTSVPLSVGITLILLILISFPRIVRMSKAEKKIQKTPRRLVKLLKILRLNHIFIIILGGIIAGIGIWLFSMFAFGFAVPGIASFALIFIYLMGIGVMVALLGVGLLMKDLHKILMIVLSKISWRIKKTKFSLSLVDVRSDINLFNNTFLTYVIIIGVIMPFILSPIAIQTKIQNETLLHGGSDLYISNWQDLDTSSILGKLNLYNEIDSISNISVYHNFYYYTSLYTLVYNNINDYLSSAFKPPKYIFEDWNDRVQETDLLDTMMVSRAFFNFVSREESSYTFSNGSAEFTFTISSTFNLYPIFYDEQESLLPSDYYFVTNKENYKKLNESTHEYEGNTIDRLLIKLKPTINQIKFAEQLEKDLNINVESTEEEADTLLIRDFPFYSLMTAEFVFGILICLVAIIFTSLSNPIKILQKRIIKHDVLKKIGIPSNNIILMTGLELLISAILPGLLLGGVAGYGLVRLTGFLMLSFTYSSIPYVIPYPYPAMLLIFLGIPILFYLIFFVAMKINFVRFTPRNLE